MPQNCNSLNEEIIAEKPIVKTQFVFCSVIGRILSLCLNDQFRLKSINDLVYAFQVVYLGQLHIKQQYVLFYGLNDP